MRLICPNCGAQYDVPDGAIPPAGREVQCSGCSHTWFEIETPVTRSPSPPIPPEYTPVAPPVSMPVTPPVDTSDRPRPIDDSVKAILREEAARDHALTPPPPAPDTTAPETAADDTRRRIARITRPDDTGTAAAATMAPAVAAEPAAAPDDMPSMDDINARLRARSKAADSAAPAPVTQEARDRRGFRRGFVVMLLAYAVLFATYIFADQITAMLPALTDSMAAYVAVVYELRLILQQTVATLSERVSALLNGG